MIKYFLYRLGEALAYILGRRGAYGLSSVIADVRFVQSKENRGIIQKNLSIVLSGSKDDVRKKTRETFHYFAKGIVDFLRLRKTDKSFIDRHVQVEGIEHLKTALAPGKGVLLVSGHLGVWELGAATLSTLGFKVSELALPHRDPRVNNYFDRQRRAVGLEVVSTRFGLRPCLRALRQNQVVAIMGDKDFTGREGVTVNFFGRPTEFPKGPGALALKAGAALVPTFMWRTKQNGYKLCMHPSLNVGNPEELNLDVTGLTQRFAHVLEKIIRAHPNQWTLFQEMWPETNTASVSV
jgi:Kdo2-lipid IVA lauroyltransferase/acyltransferase